MIFNDAGLALLKTFEGFKPQAYFDVGSVPTIGYGFTQGVLMGDTMTEDEAQIRLEKEIQHVSDNVSKLLTTNLSDNQFSAVCCLVYNIGIGNFESSTILKFLNQEDNSSAALEFLKWDKVHGNEIKGLLNRREAEKILFLF